MRISSRKAALGIMVLASFLGACQPNIDPPIRTGGDVTPNCDHPIPSVEKLQDMLNKASDESIPKEDKVDLLEDGSKDPELFDQLVQAKHDNPDIEYKILNESKIDAKCLLHVFFSISKGEQRLDKVEVFFVWRDEKWKLAKRSVCSLLVDILQKSSPLCSGYVPSGPFPSLTIPSDVHIPQ